MTVQSQCLTPGAHVYECANPQPGDVVIAYSRGRYRTVQVEKVGPLRVQVSYQTASGHVTKKYATRGEVFASSPESEHQQPAGVVRQPIPRRGRIGAQTLEV